MKVKESGEDVIAYSEDWLLECNKQEKNLVYENNK